MRLNRLALLGPLLGLLLLVPAGVAAAQADSAARGARDAVATGPTLYNLETTTPAGWRAVAIWRTPGG